MFNPTSFTWTFGVQVLSQIEKDVDRDFFMGAEEAKKYGIVDEILKPKGK